jgi:hypothetical protein
MPTDRQTRLVAVPEDGEHVVPLPGATEIKPSQERRNTRPQTVHGPRYLALNVETGPGIDGRKPLYGWEWARRHEAVVLVEGPFDWLLLLSWGFPALALGGTHAGAATAATLASRFRRVYVALDNDEAGRRGTAALLAAFATHGTWARPVPYRGVGDVGELAGLPDGRATFSRAMALARRAPVVATAAWSGTTMARSA